MVQLGTMLNKKLRHPFSSEQKCETTDMLEEHRVWIALYGGVGC